MKVKDLIEELQKLNPESVVGLAVPDDDGGMMEFDIDRVDNAPEPMIVSE